MAKAEVRFTKEDNSAKPNKKQKNDTATKATENSNHIEVAEALSAIKNTLDSLITHTKQIYRISVSRTVLL